MALPEDAAAACDAVTLTRWGVLPAYARHRNAWVALTATVHTAVGTVLGDPLTRTEVAPFLAGALAYAHLFHHTLQPHAPLAAPLYQLLATTLSRHILRHEWSRIDRPGAPEALREVRQPTTPPELTLHDATLRATLGVQVIAGHLDDFNQAYPVPDQPHAVPDQQELLIADLTTVAFVALSARYALVPTAR